MTVELSGEGRVRPAVPWPTPVDHQRLTVLADDNVARLDIRCSTPRLWAYSMALQTSVNRAGVLRSSSDRRPGSFFNASSAWNCSMASLSESPRMNRMA